MSVLAGEFDKHVFKSGVMPVEAPEGPAVLLAETGNPFAGIGACLDQDRKVLPALPGFLGGHFLDVSKF
jgi:hypothetical protein